MTWKIFEFLDPRRRGIIELWIEEARIQTKARARLNAKLDMLEQHGPDLSTGLLAGPIDGHIYKLRVHGDGVQLRPLLCRGPIHNEGEFTLLLGATERGGRLVPADAPKRAETHRQAILADPGRRRLHEHPF
jgi:hypothetical protein